MTRIVRSCLLVAVLGLAVPVLAPRAAAAGEITQTDLGLPRPIVKPAMKWLKDNWKMLYIAFDELIDDLTGCPCEPLPTPIPDPYPEPLPVWN